METAEGYYRLLKPYCRRVEVWQTRYYHALGGTDAIVEWFMGSGLRPYLAALDAVERVEFVSQYREALAREYPLQADGTVLLPFPRLFFVATR